METNAAVLSRRDPPPAACAAGNAGPRLPENPWRLELRSLLDAAAAARQPALRRSRKADWLFCTDLPLCAPAEAVEAFLARSEALGWECLSEEGWLNLRQRDSLFPDRWWDTAARDGEAACLRGLISRHPELFPSRAQACQILKAWEEGPDRFMAACLSVHRDFALRLREGRKLLLGKEDPLPPAGKEPEP